MRTLLIEELTAISGGLNLANVNKPICEFTFSQFLEAVVDLIASASSDLESVVAAYPWIQKYIDNPIEF